MEIRIKSTDYEMTPETAAYLDERLTTIARLVGDDQTALCNVEIGRSVGSSQQGAVWKAEIIISRGSERFVAVAQEESINAAIDIAKDEMLQQLRKNKGKTTVLSRRAGMKIKEWLRFSTE